MIRRAIIGIAGLLLLGTSAAVAQQDTAKCNTVNVSKATVTDIPALVESAACWGRNVISSANSQKLRLDKIAELVKAAPTPAPTPTPTPKPPVGDQEEPELGKDLTTIPAYVPSNFKYEDAINTGWPIPGSAAPDSVGAFRFICTAGQILRDDPIVFPGQPGKSHLHQFFGNTKANAFSTYKSLREDGESTCGGMLNRSAYWIPAMLDGKGSVVRPDFVSIYYKRAPANSAECQRMGICVDLPRGLRMIFGYNMVSDTQPTGAAHYDCQGKTAKSGSYRLIADVAPNCGPNNQMGVVLNAPNCWDGKHLDSPDHRSHLAYADYGTTGVYKCPATHIYVIPAFTLGAWYDTGPIDIGLPGSVTTWRLSSDDMNMGGKITKMPAGMTIHADWHGAWDEAAQTVWTANCINLLLSCSSGDLGNGTSMKRTLPFSWKAEPRLVDVPAA